MYTIGQFAAISQLSKKMLRFYDEMNLLKPAKVDWDSGYRYYDDNSVVIAQQIIVFKNCGLSLDEIKRILNVGQHNHNNLYDILVSRRKEIERLAMNIDNSKVKLEQMINELSGVKNEEPELIEIEPMEGIYKEVDLSDENAVSEKLSDLYSWGATSGFSFIPPHLILHNIHDENDTNEAKVFVKTNKPTEGDDKKEILPLNLSGGKGVRIIHRGSFFLSGETWKRLFKYIEKNHLTISGYGREIKNIIGPSVTIEVQVKEVSR